MNQEQTPVQTTEQEPEEKDRISLKEIIFEWATSVFLFMVLVLLMMTFFFRQVTVKGPSMNDTLKDQDRLIISCFLYTPQPGDVVVISHGESYSDPIIKRVIATAGQSLSIDYTTGEVRVDGVLIDEPYIKGRTVLLSNPLEIPEVIPEGYVFVMGDNRENSLDSRSTKIGLIPVENIMGKAVLRLYPFDSFGGI